ncbi:unnamed protein product [Protopolystoma xenopodis]|uniref:Uncharacterized protein n=1 Tax=Protopolystoma xenopodis TaxID=117903 RepID=A0A3S5AA97_9PLAT|nr:unnamed protein product [Protopolystoma xenopodis]
MQEDNNTLFTKATVTAPTTGEPAPAWRRSDSRARRNAGLRVASLGPASASIPTDGTDQ